MPETIETKPAVKAKPEPRDPKHAVSRTIKLNDRETKVEFTYDLDPKYLEGSAKRKEEAFDAVMLKKYPSAKRSRGGGKFHYTIE